MQTKCSKPFWQGRDRYWPGVLPHLLAIIACLPLLMSEPAAAEVAASQAIAPSLPDVDIQSGYTVQLASYLSEGRAMRGWTELRNTAPELLETIAPVVHRAELGQDAGTVYRLRTAPTSKGEAEALCTELKSRDIDCLVIKEAPAKVDAETQAG